MASVNEAFVGGKAPRALAWWLGLMTPNEEVVGSIPHAGVVLTTLWPIHISRWNGSFDRDFWTLVDGNNGLQEIPLIYYHAVPHRIL